MSLRRLVLLAGLAQPLGCWDIIEGDHLIHGSTSSGGTAGSGGSTGSGGSSGSTGSGGSSGSGGSTGGGGSGGGAGPLCGAHVWSKAFGDQTGQSNTGMALDPDGNVLLTGFSGGPIDFGGGALPAGGGFDAYVAKLDPAGEHLWDKRFGDGFEQFGLQVAADAAGNVIVVGAFQGTVDLGGGPFTNEGTGSRKNAFVVKLDPDGNHVWSKSFSGDGEAWSNALALDADGGPVIAGVAFGTIDFGGGPLTTVPGDPIAPKDAFVVRLDADGNHVWSKIFGDAADQEAQAVSVDSAGNVLVTGSFVQSIDLSGGEPGKALTSGVPQGAYGFAAKLDPGGDHLWSKPFGHTGPFLGAFDAADNPVLVFSYGETIDFGGGLFQTVGGKDIGVAKLDPAGDHVWSESFGGNKWQEASVLRVDGTGNVLLGGWFEGSFNLGGGLLVPNDKDAFFAILDPSGQHVFSVGYGSPRSTKGGTGIAASGNGDIVIGGNFEGTINLGGDDLGPAGGVDAFLAKLASCNPASESP